MREFVQRNPDTGRCDRMNQVDFQRQELYRGGELRLIGKKRKRHDSDSSAHCKGGLKCMSIGQFYHPANDTNIRVCTHIVN